MRGQAQGAPIMHIWGYWSVTNLNTLSRRPTDVRTDVRRMSAGRPMDVHWTSVWTSDGRPYGRPMDVRLDVRRTSV